jgi:hypothetical protein
VYLQEWDILTPEDTDLILGLDEESTGSVGDWSGLDTLQSIHPLDFADSLSSVGHFLGVISCRYMLLRY